MRTRPFLTLLLFLSLLLPLAGCGFGGGAEEEGPAVAPTPLPTKTPPGLGNAASTGVLPGVSNQVLPTATPLNTPTPQATPRPQEEKQNTWLDINPPNGWVSTEGKNGVILSVSEGTIPDTPYLMVQRWQNVMSLDAWGAWFPDGQEMANSSYTFTINGRSWDGLFILGATYKAFYATSPATGGDGGYTILVFVPVPVLELVDDDGTAVYDEWDAWASDELRSALAQIRIIE